MPPKYKNYSNKKKYIMGKKTPSNEILNSSDYSDKQSKDSKDKNNKGQSFWEKMKSIVSGDVQSNLEKSENKIRNSQEKKVELIKANENDQFVIENKTDLSKEDEKKLL